MQQPITNLIHMNPTNINDQQMLNYNSEIQKRLTQKESKESFATKIFFVVHNNHFHSNVYLLENILCNWWKNNELCAMNRYCSPRREKKYKLISIELYRCSSTVSIKRFQTRKIINSQTLLQHE